MGHFWAQGPGQLYEFYTHETDLGSITQHLEKSSWGIWQINYSSDHKYFWWFFLKLTKLQTFLRFCPKPRIQIYLAWKGFFTAVIRAISFPAAHTHKCRSSCCPFAGFPEGFAQGDNALSNFHDPGEIHSTFVTLAEGNGERGRTCLPSQAILGKLSVESSMCGSWG